ncbi:MAG: LuxR C-terminal-related transcriptional regulator [Ktedonobacterales bacterium]
MASPRRSLVAAGAANAEIAARMGVRIHTGKSHRKNLDDKLGAESRTHALARARELGLL